MKDQHQREKFFLIVPVGFESHLINELKEVQSHLLGADLYPNAESIEILNQTRGGVEILVSRAVGFQLNHFLKTAVRVLWRWKSKKISHVSEFKTWVRSLHPQEFIEGDISVSISAKKSRLQNEKMLMRVLQEDWKSIKQEPQESLYLHVFDDQMTFSWDTTGEPLYKRGWSELKGQAPLRENLAHLLLQDLSHDLTGPEREAITLVDPMMGSGTFLSESFTWNRPMVERSFQYQNLKGRPGFLKIQWWKNLPHKNTSLFGRHAGFDQNSEMVKVAEKNLKNTSDLNSVVLEKRDVLKEKASEKIDGRRFMISNPPYGERLGVKDLQKLLGAALEKYQPERALFVVPAQEHIEAKNYAIKHSRPFSNGGLDVKSLIFQREV